MTNHNTNGANSNSASLFGANSLSAATLDGLSDPVFVCTLEGQLVYGNRRIREATGYDEEAFSSLHVADLFSGRAGADGLERLREGSDCGDFAGELQPRSGPPRSCRVEGSRIEYEGEVFICGILRQLSNQTHWKTSSRDGEEKYRRLFEESQEGIAIAAPTGEILAVNPAVSALTGYSREELLDMNASDLYVEADRRAELLRRLREEGEVQDMELHLRHKNGEEVLTQVRATVWRNEEGEIEAIQTYVRDISRRRHHEEQFRLLVEEVKEYAIFMLDPEGYVTTWNEGAERIKGYTEEGILGTHFSTFYPEEAVEAGRPEEGLETAAREGQWVDEGWRVRKDGSRFWALVTITALHGEDGSIRGFAKVTRDLTDRRQKELELETQKRRAERENALLRLMQTVAATANDADSLEGALQQAVNAVCEHIDWPVGHVYWVRRNGDPSLESSPIWCLEDEDRFGTVRSVTEATEFPSGESLPGLAAARDEPVWMRNVNEESTFLRSRQAENLGVKGAFAFPVRFDGRVEAVLEFFSEAEEEPDEELLEAMESVGVQLSRVAEREKARTELRRSEKRYRRLFETSQEGIVIQAADHTITDVNPAALDILGYDRDELVGTEPTRLFADLEQRRQARHTIETEGQFRNVEFEVRRRDGEQIICEATATLRRDAEDEREVFYTIFRDVTERKRMQEAMRESEKRYRRLFEESRDAIILTTPEGEVVDANGRAETLFGYSRDELLSLDAAELYADPEERRRRIVPKLETSATSRLLEAEMRHRDGHTFPATASVTVHRDEEGHPELIQALVRDISERRRLEEELLQVQDEERQRLGQELHDGVGSLLTAASIKTSTLAGIIKQGGEIDPDELDEATEYIKQAAKEARAISHGLSPVGLEGGLLAALEELASQAEVRGDLSCSFEASGSVPELSEETATHLYRIAQEAVNNAIQHAEAQHIWLHLTAADEGVPVLTVQDDGQGYSGSSSNGEEGLGMRTMRRRANLIGGSLAVENASEGGTVVRCRLSSSECL